MLTLLPTSSLPQVVKVKPHDKDAKMKYQECNKIVKQKAFERAIAGDEHKRSVVDSLDIESMSESGTEPTPPPRELHAGLETAGGGLSPGWQACCWLPP